MNTQAKRKRIVAIAGKVLSIGIVLGALAVGIHALREREAHPWTDDAAIDAEVVHIAPAVGGRLLTLAVSENARVAKGDLLFQIDPLPYELLVAQARADLEIARAELATRRRVLMTERSNATIAADHVKAAEENHALAERTAARLHPLGEKGYVPQQQIDQADVAVRDSATAVLQAREHRTAAQNLIDTEAAAEAAVRARSAALAIAQRQLDDTTVRAPHNGIVVGLGITSGEMVAPTQSLFTLISSEEWLAVANFRETELSRLKPGDCVTAFSLIDRTRAIKGVIEGVGWGVLDLGKVNLPRSAPFVERSLNWVRVAQRFPVRIKLEDPPPELMRLGTSAVVEVKHGSACR
ncbi:MAG: multidrug transporter subunit MdtN [Pseudomonadota bacterium]